MYRSIERNKTKRIKHTQPTNSIKINPYEEILPNYYTKKNIKALNVAVWSKQPAKKSSIKVYEPLCMKRVLINVYFCGGTSLRTPVYKERYLIKFVFYVVEYVLGGDDYKVDDEIDSCNWKKDI